MSHDPLKLRGAARAEYHARWEAVEAAKAQELVAMTEERAWQIIRSLRPFTGVPRDAMYLKWTAPRALPPKG